MSIHLQACIKMAMLRGAGKAAKIAMQVIPGFNKNRNMRKKSPKHLPKDDVELKIVDINEKRGRSYG